MKGQDLIPVKLLCKRYGIPIDFINMLQEFQLIELIVEKNNFFIHTPQVKEIEKIIRLYYDLNINLEGVDAINNLLKQVEDLQQEIKCLQNKLNRYE